MVNTGIAEVQTGHQTATQGIIYNLQGQRVGRDYKGVVISNGKKYIKW